MSVTTRIWLHKLNGRPASREFQSKSTRNLLQLACRSNGTELNAGHLALPSRELIDLIDKDFGLGITITHCPKLVAVALGKGQLGLDCEPLGRKRNWHGIADHFFTPEEASTIASAGTEEQEQIFLRHWVLKESYIKSVNGSIIGDMNRLALSDLGETAQVESCADDHSRWAWVGSFAGCVLGMYCSHTTPPKLAFYEAADMAGLNSTPCRSQVPGSFIPITQQLNIATSL